MSAMPNGRCREALRAFAAIAGDACLRASRLYRTAAWGSEDQPAFVNAVAELETTLDARTLLERAARDRAQLGRERAADGSDAGARACSTSTCCCTATQLIDEPGLHVPHPHLHERAFVLLPLAEIAPELNIPGRGRARDASPRWPPKACRR